MARLKIGYLSLEYEKKMLVNQKLNLPLDKVNSIITLEQLLELQELVRNIRIEDSVYQYIISIISKTRNCPGVEYGASPRGALDLMRASQAEAILNDRNFVIPDDVKISAPDVLAHRIILKKGTRLTTSESSSIILEILDSVEVSL